MFGILNPLAFLNLVCEGREEGQEVFLCAVVSLVRFASGLIISTNPSGTFLNVAFVMILIHE